MIEQIKSALISAVVSGLFSGVVLYYLRKYLDRRMENNEVKAIQRRKERRKLNILEQRYRRAVGRLLFWICDALMKGVEHANGDLKQARIDFNEAEDALKNYEQELLAARVDENLTEP